jgi:hypothetical protein
MAQQNSADTQALNVNANLQNISPITNITDKMNMGLNHPVINIQQMQ